MAKENDLEIMRSQIAALEKANASLLEKVHAAGAMRPAVQMLSTEEQPVYEIVNEAFYSPDDVLYPVGTQFADVTGMIIPNENMHPLNEPAKRRIQHWMDSLPVAGAQPSIEHILQAAMEMRPREGESPLSMIEFQTATIKRAMEIKYNGQSNAPRPATLPVRAKPRIAVRPSPDRSVRPKRRATSASL